MRGAVRAAAIAVACGASLAGASAHVTVAPRQAPAGRQTALSFDVMHGCGGSATTSITLKIPAGVISAKPQAKPGWSIDIVPRQSADAPHAAMSHEAAVPGEITWRGGPLPDALYDSFVVMMKLPDAPGSTLTFPVVQRCESGERRWTESGESHGAHDGPGPAPVLTLTPAAP